MNEETYRELVKEVFAESPHGADNLLDHLHFTNDGLLASSSESCGTLGFGIASGITPTPEILSIVADVNRLMTFGHYWLAAGADNSNWSLVCGFKFPYATSDPKATADLMVGIMQHNGALIATVRQQLGDISHEPYWFSDAESGPQAFVLVGHLS